MKPSDISLNDQLQKRFIWSLFLVGMVYIVMVIGLRFIVLQKTIESRNEYVTLSLEHILQKTMALEKSLNQEMLSEASNGAFEVYKAHIDGTEVTSQRFSNTMLYRIVDKELKVIDSNYTENGVTSFLPYAGLFKSEKETVQQFNENHIQMVQMAFAAGYSTSQKVDVFEKNHVNAFVLYKPYSNKLLIEIIIDTHQSQNAIGSYMNMALGRLFDDAMLENLSLTASGKEIFKKGTVKNNPGFFIKNQPDSVLRVTHTIGDVNLTYGYQLNAKSDYYLFFATSTVFFLLLVLVIVFIYWLTRSETARLLSPFFRLLAVAKEGKSGRYDKRIELSGFYEFSILGDTYNAMMDRIEPLLDAKKKHEYKLMQLTILEEKHSQTTNVLIKETCIKKNDLEMQLHSLQKLYFDTLFAFCDGIEMKDMYSKGHCMRVMELSVLMARWCHMDQEDVELVRLGAILHDIGKMHVSDEILNKLEPFTDYEKSLVQRHCLYGEEAIAELGMDERVKSIVSSHHEFYNGEGYPMGLKGEEISLGARIVGLIDAYDAMCSGRPYRLTPLGIDEIIEELNAGAGSQFDPQLVHLLLDHYLLKEGAEDAK